MIRSTLCAKRGREKRLRRQFKAYFPLVTSAVGRRSFFLGLRCLWAPLQVGGQRVGVTKSLGWQSSGSFEEATKVSGIAESEIESHLADGHRGVAQLPFCLHHQPQMDQFHGGLCADRQAGAS